MTAVVSAQELVLCEAWIPGHAKTKGSLEHIGGGKMRESVTGSKTWRQLAARMVKPFVNGEPYRGRVGVLVTSFLKPPERMSLAQAREWILGDKSGDADKLLRNVCDAIGCEDKDDARLILNDGQVSPGVSYKRLAYGGSLPGQMIRVWAVPESEPW